MEAERDQPQPQAPGGTARGDHQRRHLDGAEPSQIPASTLMIEVDGFDAVSRRKRRAKILDQVAWVITDTVRSTDTVFRHGDAGFCVVLTHTDDAAAMGAANRIRNNVEIMPLLADAGVTVSVAVAAGTDDDLASTIQRAERAMSSAHSSNQVVRADDAD